MQRSQVCFLWNKCLDLFQGFTPTMNLIQIMLQCCWKKNYWRYQAGRHQRAEVYPRSLDSIYLGSLVRLRRWSCQRQCQLKWHSGFLGRKLVLFFFVFEEKGSFTRLTLQETSSVQGRRFKNWEKVSDKERYCDGMLCKKETGKSNSFKNN